MTDKIIAAIIGAAVAVIVMLIRDILVRYFFESWSDKKSAKTVYRQYADPLSASAANLLWRLDEILNQPGRGAYLRSDIATTKFVSYKRLSTIYRVCNLLGWIRAFRRELSFLRGQAEENVKRTKDSLSALERALADGAHIETRRLDSLLDLWKHAFSPIEDPVRRARVQYCIEHELKEFLHNGNVDLATELPEEQQLVLCGRLAGIIAKESGEKAPEQDILSETRARVIKSVSLREAWLYRDWQTGIGDLMIAPAPEGGDSLRLSGSRSLRICT